MTIKEAIVHVAKTLEEINLPVGLIKTVGVPLSNSVDLLKQCVQAIEQTEQEEPKQEETENADSNGETC